MPLDSAGRSDYLAPVTQESFAGRWQDLREKRGPFCLNLDPTPELLSGWGMDDGVGGLAAFCQRVLEAAGDRLSVIKPQSAYFERFGAPGVQVLSDILAAIRSSGTLALLDAKRGDIGSTNRGYAEGLLGPRSALGADALTVHAYLGFAALRPLLEQAEQHGCGVFPVVLSSNPEGRALQSARMDDGLSVAESLAESITAYNAEHTGADVGPIGAVVGVSAENAEDIVVRLPRSLILAPGLGAQGGTVADVIARFEPARARVLPCAGRSVLASGPDLGALRSAICQQAEALHDALG